MDIKTIDLSNKANIDKDELMALVLEEYKDKPNIIIKDNDKILATIETPIKEYLYMLYNKEVSPELQSIYTIESFTLNVIGYEMAEKEN